MTKKPVGLKDFKVGRSRSQMENLNKVREKPITARECTKMVIGHGPDNYEELIDLSKVVLIKASFTYDSQRDTYLDANDGWRTTAILIFESGHSEKIYLTEKGYDELRTEWLALATKIIDEG